MNIVDLAILKKMVAGGGGSGTDNYNDLTNLPQINGETLAGNKTAANLGLQDALTFDSAPTEDSTNPVESGGVFNALAGKQDNLTFDDDPTENSTNPVKSGGVYSALVGKQDNLTFDGVYNASTNKAATESTVTNAIAGLDVSAFSVDADETISGISETDGKVSVTKQDIAIASNQVVAMTGYAKPSSAPSNPAIQTSDTANQAFGKLEFKADTNQSNIWYALNDGVKNLFPINSGSVSGDGYLNKNNEHGEVLVYPIPAGSYKLKWTVSSTATNCGFQIILADGDVSVAANRISTTTRTVTNTTTTFTDDITIPSGTTATHLVFYINNTGSVSNVMLCRADLYSQDSTYVPFALPNYDLTRLEAEDRAGLVDVVDSGAKNLLDLSPTDTSSITKSEAITITRDSANEFTITRAASPTAVQEVKIPIPTSFPTNKYVILSGCPSNGAYATYSVEVWENNAYLSDAGGDYGSGTKEFKFSTTTGRFIRIRFGDNTSFSNLKFKFMCCTKAAFGVSQKYVPFKFPESMKLVAHKSAQGNLTTALEYTPSSSEFNIGYTGDTSTGIYLVSCVNWATQGQPYICLITHSGGQIANLTKTVIVNGFEPTIDLTGGKISISGCSRASIYALR